MSNISKIRISGNTYQLKDEEATNVVELTQAEYDQLPSSAKTSNTLFIITDAQGADLSNYYTKSETSGATEISTALASKADAATTYSKTEVDTALASKQTTLTAGTNITIVDNVISATGGGGGGKAISGGTNISITTGETADTINCTLPISAASSNIIIKNGSNGISTDNNFSQVFGSGNTISAYGGYNQNCITVEGIDNSCGTSATHVEGGHNRAIYGSFSHVEGAYNTLAISVIPSDEVCSHVEGKYNKVLNYSEHASGQYNNSVSASTTFGDSGNTLFSVGNGTSTSARHNAFEIRQNGDIYITSGGTDIKLQDNLGGGGTVDQTVVSGSTNAVAGGAVYTQLDGLKLKKITQSAYNALSPNYDANTLYVING